MIINTRRIVDHLLLLMTIAISGFPFFSSTILLIPLFVILSFVFLLRKRGLDVIFVWSLLLLLVITASQSLIFNFFSLQTSAGVFLRLINGYLIIKILRDNFAIFYVNILFMLSLISLLFFIPIISIPGFDNFLIDLAPFFQIANISGFDGDSLILYTLRDLTSSRNAGPFWEAGAFGGYLIVAFIFNKFTKSSNKKIKELIILIAILSTLSSTAYFVIFFFLFIFYFRHIKNFFLKISIIILLVCFGYFATALSALACVSGQLFRWDIVSFS